MFLRFIKENQDKFAFKVISILLLILGLSVHLRFENSVVRSADSELQMDFPAYYVTGKVVEAGLDPYESENIKLYSELNSIPYTVYRSIHYPPPFLILTQLFIQTDILTAQKYFSHFKYFLYLVTIFMTIGYVTRYQTEIKIDRNTYIFFCGLVLTLFARFWPIQNDFLNGQINILAMFLIVISVLFIENPILSGFSMAIAILMKLNPVLFLVFFFFKKEYKNIFYTLLFIGIFSLISIISFGLELHLNYIKNLLLGFLTSDKIQFLSWPISIAHNQTIKGFFYRLFVMDFMDPHFGTKVLIDAPLFGKISAFLVNLLILFYVLLKSFQSMHLKNSTANNLLLFSLYTNCILLISPISWVHHKVLLIPVNIVLLFKLIRIQEYKKEDYFLLFLFASSLILLSINHLYPYNQLEYFGIIFSYIHLIGNLINLYIVSVFLNRNLKQNNKNIHEGPNIYHI
ncbi:MAG: DUF2029 domain-containing protein [Leptospiraceae bacterium]|nr:DUF2029 domain-containing protein [Leptospiraceae bacterium]MCP5511132.1 DUF2029 domain-containing protein [Leptospiraceae bacterium]